MQSRPALFNVFIIANENDRIKELCSELTQKGFGCSIVSGGEETIKQCVEQSPDMALVDIDGSSSNRRAWGLLQGISPDQHLPIMALIPKEMLDILDRAPGIDDFVIKPWNPIEVVARIKRILERTYNTCSKELINCGELVINTARCEVYIKNRSVALTFREYELLKFLASNKERVFSRESLLNEVWGYDYYGGDRTVDVHIRRLRSKIESTNCTFIETVRNIGYKFKKEA